MLKDRTNSHLITQQQQSGKLLAKKVSINCVASEVTNLEIENNQKHDQDKLCQNAWNVVASCGSVDTINPIREIIETMNLAENPNKKVIPLSIGDPTIFGNLKPCDEILEALGKTITGGKYFGYQTASGIESARDAVATYHNKLTGNNVKRQVSI